jgi:predicted CXXCH cytochrome family protein
MLPATHETVVGDFANASFTYAGNNHRFYSRDGKFFAETDNAQGDMQEFEIAYIFGYYPLQQYLVAFPDGRFQVLGTAWDSRAKAEGGQRWYHLYPDDSITHEDILHWTGSFQNWNSRCAACHSTELKKNYSPATNTYATQWAEINVACEACHGPGSAHVTWVASGRATDDPGFSNVLSGKGVWARDGEKTTLRRQDGDNANAQVEVCAACHSRRVELSEDHAGKRFSDLFQLRLLEQDVYFADGQVRDEVYEYGSFLQSKMHAAGVACTNCHEPHSGNLLAEGNALCGQCHQAAFYDRLEHHHHPVASSGAACVGCHMPATIYMGVDKRHDHSFRIPEPALTVELGIPNACNRCHQDKDAPWAADAVAGWHPQADSKAAQARLMTSAWQNQAEALPGLIELASTPGKPPILRATAVLETARFPSREALAMIQLQLDDSDPLVRGAAARALEQLPTTNRYALLQPLITDPSKSVRMEVARVLADMSPERVSANGQGELTALRKEYLDSLMLNADMPESLLNLGVYMSLSGKPEEAEQAYRKALKLSPAFVPAMINLADLYREAGLDSEAGKLLQSAIDLAPGSAAAQHAMGLLLVRQRELARAVPFLKLSAELDPANSRYAYVYAVALFETGQKKQAVTELEQSLLQHPGNPELISALQAYYTQLGETKKLRELEQSLPQ